MSGPVDNWLAECDLARAFVDVYSDDFLQSFERSDFYTVCKNTVAGKLKWKEWSDCSVSCGGGTQTKIASSCVPDYAICYGIQISERTCEEQACPIGQWRWNDWSECTASCNGGIRFKTAHSCQPLGAECKEVPVINESCNTIACQDGQWTWNDWGECSHTCGGGIRFRTANKCLPDGAFCEEVPIMEESCNQQSCPGPSTFFPPGSIISWVPKPNKFSSTDYSFNDDAWIVCDGMTKCQKGVFRGQACSDLSDRVLVGAGKTGVLLDLKDASLPDHEHKHRHSGTKKYSISYQAGPRSVEKRKQYWTGSGNVAFNHQHTTKYTTDVTVNFADMTEDSTPISNIKSPKVTKSSVENELYSPHMRVQFIFKCY